MTLYIYASDKSDKKPRKIANIPNRKPVYKNPFSVIPSRGTQEAVASVLAKTDRISECTLSPPPIVPLVVSPPRSPTVANAGITLVIHSSQESEQVRDAGAVFAQLAEHTLDNELNHSPPRDAQAETTVTFRPGSATHIRTCTRPAKQQVTPMEDWVFSTQELHWFQRLKAGGYPNNKALKRCIKYYTITNKAIANIIKNRQLYNQTKEEEQSTNASIEKIKKLGNQISAIAESALYNRPPSVPNHPKTPINQDKDKDTYMGKPKPGPNQPNPITTKITWGTKAKPGKWGRYLIPMPAPAPATSNNQT
ncbi:hypothetical protein RHS03_02567, partial [Rhizoctonia solani]